jgi:hypothetical protein
VHTRSTTFVLAVALVAATGAAFAIGGLVLVWLARGGAVHQVSAETTGILLLLGVLSFAVAGVAWAAVVDLWHGRSRGWPGALAVAVLAVGAALSALVDGGLQAPLVVGGLLSLGTFGTLLASAPRGGTSVRMAGA